MIMISDYWFDFIEEMRHYWTIDKYLLLFISSSGYKGKIPSANFWAITFLFMALHNGNIKIVFSNGEILTSQDCFNEMEDCYIKERGGELYLWLLQKKEFFGW